MFPFIASMFLISECSVISSESIYGRIFVPPNITFDLCKLLVANVPSDLRPGINHFQMAPAASELSRVNDLRAWPVWLRGYIIMGIHSRD
jgi:hypothetical protein